MNNCWLKKYEKSVTVVRKGKTKKRSFPSQRWGMFCIIPFYFYQSKLGFCICFFNVKVVNVANYELSPESSYREISKFVI